MTCRLYRTSFLFTSCPTFFPVPVAKSQPQCLKSHFPSPKLGKSQLPFYPFKTLIHIQFLSTWIFKTLRLCRSTTICRSKTISKVSLIKHKSLFLLLLPFSSLSLFFLSFSFCGVNLLRREPWEQGCCGVIFNVTGVGPTATIKSGMQDL